MSALLEVRALHRAFAAVVAANDINVTIGEGEAVGVIGANGAGKTTFINMITGWLAPTSGSIRFEGRELVGLRPRQVTRVGVARSFQVSQVFMTLSVFDNVLTALAIAQSKGLAMFRPMRRPALIARCHEVLERFGLLAYRGQTADQLPQGVRKLLDVAMAVVSGPRLLLLDEPTSGVSVDEKFELMDIVMSALSDDGVTIVFIEHDMEIVARYVDRVLAFYQGEIICDAAPVIALNDPLVRTHVLGSAPATDAVDRNA